MLPVSAENRQGAVVAAGDDVHVELELDTEPREVAVPVDLAVVVTAYVSLDGIFDEPGEWSFPFWNEEAFRFKFDELFASDAQLLGRLTYEGFAQAWPTMSYEVGFADRMNSMPKYVVSTTLENPEWTNTTVIRENVPEAVAQLKQEPGQDILVAGSAQLVRVLAEHNLVDEYRFMVHPIVLGSGNRIFDQRMDLKLVDTKRFSSGIVVLTYEPGPKESEAQEAPAQ
jgi:dihydrofolate reductase